MNKIVEQITAEILRENLSMLKANPQSYELVMNKYGKIFFDKLKEKSTKTTYGLQIGLTKRFFEFTLLSMENFGIGEYEHKFDSIFNGVITDAILTSVNNIENNSTVYIIYRNLKKSIDKNIKEMLEM